ncbi:DUF4129 domain-containing protein [Rufibacter tibetensis]|uniref:DUF4129 domain-containing protein n=1 Tax=Rufibacter tibetensis TaxID=512763 RepID=UPI00147015EE|nr:DUF4129 domain-containing protein [Rufibacter tibetensis]
MRHILLLFCLLLWCCALAGSTFAAVPAQAQAAVQPLQIRQPNPQKLKELRENKDFHYQQDVRPDMSFWERFWRKVGEYIARLLEGSSYQGFWKYILYALAIGTTVFVVLKLFQVDFVGLFGRKAAPAAITYDTYRENIHEIDFESLLEEAETQGDYRRAVRLYYLRTLKALTDAGLIDWKPGKTNWSYVSELNQSPLRKPFERITHLFEYVWYGGSQVDSASFETLRKSFEEFTGSLSKAA